MNPWVTAILAFIEVMALSFLAVQIMVQVHKRCPGFLPPTIEQEIEKYIRRKHG